MPVSTQCRLIITAQGGNWSECSNLRWPIPAGHDAEIQVYV